MLVNYCELWNRQHKEVIGPLTADSALERERNSQNYTVIIGNTRHPECFIEINPATGFFGVSFLDHRQREYLAYGFILQLNGLLFLSQATYQEFEDNEDRPLRGTAYFFDTDGRMRIERGEQPFSAGLVSEGRFDPTTHWEKRPLFGQYGDLIRKERPVSSG